MKKPKLIDVLFFVEHVDREMQGTKEIKKWLEENCGLSVHIASIGFGLFQSWKRFTPKVLCLPYCKSKKSVMVRLFKTRNPQTIVINLNYEQLLSSVTEKYKRPQDQFAKDELVHFTWGEHFKNYLISNGVKKENIHVVGKPEIQFLLNLKKSTGDNFRTDIANKEGLNVTKTWIFIPINDGPAFRSQQFIEALVKKGGANLDDLVMAKESTLKQINILFEWISRLSVTNNLEFVYRPHPGVDITNYTPLLEKYKLNNNNAFHLTRSFTIKEWLCSSQICISNISTTMVDAQIVGMDTYIFMPSLLADKRRADWLQAFTPINSYNDFVDCLSCSSNAETHYDNYYIDITGDVIEKWGKAISQYVELYKGCDSMHSYKAFRLEWKQLFRSEFRRIAIRLGLDSMVSRKISYDYFEII